MAKAYFINKVLATTVVGSYPVVKGTGLSSLFDPLSAAVKTAVADQMAAGIDIISDGQVRGDMIQAFASRLPGIKGQEVIGKVQPASSPITRPGHEICRVEGPESERASSPARPRSPTGSISARRCTGIRRNLHLTLQRHSRSRHEASKPPG